jgi:GalNAc-alpha-(1->4)-GalNAc-alpha-(1->3)-diNAcBac-PP-undecaprenol alpha-1,4-N-acetyl-D-galactosaminyltransferase
MAPRLRILCAIPTMGPGGAERVMAHLVSHLATRHEILLVTLDAAEAASFYPLPEVKRIHLDLLGGSGPRRSARIVLRPLRLRQVIREIRPDIVLSFLDTMNVTCVAASLGLKVTTVVSERSDPALNTIGRPRRLLRDAAYRMADVLIVQTRRAADYFPPATRRHIRVLPNPVPRALVAARPDHPRVDGRWRIVALGRLSQEKQFDLLIEAFARLAPDRPDWDLVIFGEGPDRALLESLAERCGAGGRVFLPGIVGDVYSEFAGSHVMAFPSRYEGFPNALAEGLSTGLPAVAYAGVNGVEELIVPGETGLLVDPRRGICGLADAMARLMDDPHCRARMGAAARIHAVKWAPDRVLAQWEEMLIELAPGRSANESDFRRATSGGGQCAE